METPLKKQPERQARILVVEDEHSVGQAMSRVLGKEGFRIFIASSAEEAVHSAEAVDFDVIFLDISLPGMTGLQAIGEFKRRSRAPIIIMTGYPDEETRKDAVLLGAAEFLEKPLNFDRVRRLIHALARPPFGPADQDKGQDSSDS